MAIEFFCAYHSYLDTMEALTDAERGRLFTACLEYSKTGEVPQLSGNERFLFPAFKAQIDRDVEKYQKKCDANREKAAKRWHTEESLSMQSHITASHSMPQHTTASNGKFGNTNHAKEKEKTKAKEKRSSIPPMSNNRNKSYRIEDIEELSHFDLPDEL